MQLTREANKEVVNACLQYMRDKSMYKVETLLVSQDLWKLPEAKSRGTMISCPFHSDSSPSMIVDDNNKFYCFGCNLKGGYWDMLYFLRTVRSEQKIGRYAILEEILKGDPRMQLAVGHNSIYITKEVKRQARQPFVPKPRQISNFSELADAMKREGLDSPQLIKLSILSIQDEMKVEEVYRLVKNASRFEVPVETGQPVEELSLDEILGGITMDMDFKWESED